tara:strand:- start:826 stop:1002 length:177 start_codon:yes stop_codon:yes gene_type:complete
MLGDIAAYVAEDGELTESKALAANWKRFDHKYTELNEREFQQLQRKTIEFVKEIKQDA